MMFQLSGFCCRDFWDNLLSPAPRLQFPGFRASDRRSSIFFSAHENRYKKAQSTLNSLDVDELLSDGRAVPTRHGVT